MTKPPANSEPSLRVADFDFHLPEDLIAQQPPAERGASRMLVVDRTMGQHSFKDLKFADLPSLLNPGDLLVLNDSRVIPARLYAHRATSRGKQSPSGLIEVLLTSPVVTSPVVTSPVPSEPGEAGNWNAWQSLVRPGRKVRTGDRLAFANAAGATVLEAEVLSSGEFGARLLRFTPVQSEFADLFAALDEIGHIPLPPYIHREDATTDRDRYQTVFAAARGSVAAPTAGLHFTPTILEAITARGVEIAKVTLHVGLGTFAPLRVDRLQDIHLHSERYTLSAKTADALNRARAENRRIVAVGTTTVRTLEHCAAQAANQPLAPHTGETNIFISPGHEFRIVNAMLTNFHLPQSSLIMLVSAFAGRERTLAAYAHAVRQQYRFFSYGDCMFIS